MAGFLEPVVAPILSPLLALPMWLVIVIIAFSISLMITLIYRAMTDQDLMKRLKAEMKEFQNEIKELKDNPEKAMKVQKEAMDTNMKYMTMSMKPTLVTFLPIIIIFGWMNAHIAFEPIMPGAEFSVSAMFEEGIDGTITLKNSEGLEILSDSEVEIVNGEADWDLKGEEGTYFLDFEYSDKQFTKELLITNERNYAQVETRVNNGDGLIMLKINNDPVKPLPFPIFGWEPGWLGTYIILSIVFSMSIRRILKVH